MLAGEHVIHSAPTPLSMRQPSGFRNARLCMLRSRSTFGAATESCMHQNKWSLPGQIRRTRQPSCGLLARPPKCRWRKGSTPHKGCVVLCHAACNTFEAQHQTASVCELGHNARRLLAATTDHMQTCTRTQMHVRGTWMQALSPTALHAAIIMCHTPAHVCCHKNLRDQLQNTTKANVPCTH